MATASMVRDFGVCSLRVECVLGDLVIIRLEMRLPTNGATGEGLGCSRER